VSIFNYNTSLQPLWKLLQILSNGRWVRLVELLLCIWVHIGSSTSWLEMPPKRPSARLCPSTGVVQSVHEWPPWLPELEDHLRRRHSTCTGDSWPVLQRTEVQFYDRYDTQDPVLQPMVSQAECHKNSSHWLNHSASQELSVFFDGQHIKHDRHPV